MNNEEIFGVWVAEKISIGQISGHIKVSKKEFTTINDYYFSEHFILDIKNDSTYSYSNELGKTIYGKYNCVDDSIKLNSMKDVWMTFKIDSIEEGKLYLSRDEYFFAYIDGIDTIDIISGFKFKAVMKKQDN